MNDKKDKAIGDAEAPEKDRSPEKLSDLHVSKPVKIAAGRRAITETFKQGLGKMGVVRGTRALLKLNQVGGIGVRMGACD